METVLQMKVLKERISQNDIALKNMLKEISACDLDGQKWIDLNRKVSYRLQNTQKDLSDLKRLVRGLERDTELRANVETELEWIQNQYEINVALARKSFQASQKILNQRNRSQLFELRNRFHNSGSKTTIATNVSNEMRANQATTLTDNLYSVSRMLATEVEKSGRNLETLVSSSATATETAEELKMMNNQIGNSATLLSKYGRREMTDKILTALAFLFFFGCVIYVLVKRLYLNRI